MSPYDVLRIERAPHGGETSSSRERSVVRVIQLWYAGIVNPFKMVSKLRDLASPNCGFFAVLIRFVVTTLTTGLALYLLGRRPFVPSEFVRLPDDRYYFAQLFFLPLWGFAIWILMTAVVHLILRLARKESDFDRILNIIGMGMLVPMPVLWLWDWAAVAFGLYKVTIMAITHSVAQVWEATVEAIGFAKVLRLKVVVAVLLSVLINGIYIALAMHFIR